MVIESLDGIGNYSFSTVDPQKSILTGAGISDGVLPQTGSIDRYYSFDAGSGSTVSDNSGNGADGALNGTLDWINGYAGYGGFSFVKGDSWMDIPNLPAYSSITLVGILAYDAWASSANSGEYAGGYHNDNHIQFTSEADRPWGRIYDGSSNYVSFSSAASTNTFYLITLRWDGSTLTMWDGGTQEDSVAVSSMDGSINQNDQIAGYQSGSDWGGDASLWISWTTALTDTEIQNLASNLGF